MTPNTPADAPMIGAFGANTNDTSAPLTPLTKYRVRKRRDPSRSSTRSENESSRRLRFVITIGNSISFIAVA